MDAAKVRVKRGARWLDENFPGWEGRININTLQLNDGALCICGQVFAADPAEYTDSEWDNGYEYAETTLFGEANGWITSILNGWKPSDSRDDDRSNEVSKALGFMRGSISYGRADSDKKYVLFAQLQDAWIDLLKERTAP